MLSKLDESVGLVVSALAEANMLKNSVIIFSTDNGGPADGFNLNAASNWPLRGVSLVNKLLEYKLNYQKIIKSFTLLR